MSHLGAVPTPQEDLRVRERPYRQFQFIVGIGALLLAVWWTVQSTPDVWPAVICGAVGIFNIWKAAHPSVIIDEKARAELMLRSESDIRAAKRLRSLLKQDLRGHALMRRHLDKFVKPDGRDQALGFVERAEQETRTQLTKVEAQIDVLRGQP